MHQVKGFGLILVQGLKCQLKQPPDPLWCRSSLALTDTTDTPLTWLNEIIEVVSKQSGDHSYLLRHITKILFKYRSEETRHLVKTWMLELMGQISTLMRTGGELSTSVMFLMDVFTLTIILLTETDSLVPVR